MPTEPPESASAWTHELAQRDKALREALDDEALRSENTALHHRLDALMVELRASRAAVAVRDGLLREHTAALAERDRALDESLADRNRMAATRSWRALRHAARLVHLPRRALARLRRR